MKHIGKMKNNSARVAVVYRTLPGDATSALVVGTHGLGDSYHDTLMQVLESPAGQQANELADVLATRRFPDGSVMLNYLHVNGHLKKVPTNLVLMTPDSQTQVQLDELNTIIAQQRGVSVEDLAVSDASAPPKTKTMDVAADKSVQIKAESLTPAEMRDRADALYKEATRLRKEADTLDPPKSKKKTTVVEVPVTEEIIA